MGPRQTKKTKVYAAESVYIDPIGCDSTVSFKIVEGRHGLYGSVQLSDCQRKIEWFFPSKRESIPKIEKAISTLSAFKESFLAAKRLSSKCKTKRTIGKKAVGTT